jgi:DNA-binding CsgD family transcriptional regulator/CRP-like cAMP-binding protein
MHIIVRNELVARLESIECLGEISCLSGQPVSATVLAIDHCKLLAVDKAVVLNLISTVPKVWQSLFLKSSHRLSLTNKRLSSFMTHASEGLMKLDCAAKVTQHYSMKCLDYFDQSGLLGKSFPELIKINEPHEIEAWMLIYSSVISTNESTFKEHVSKLTKEFTLMKNGVERIFSLSYFPSINIDGSIDGVDVGILDVTEVRNLRRKLVHKLSPREITILELIADGLVTKEIARLLSLSPHTVRDHMKVIYKKLNVHTKTQAIRKVFSVSNDV